MDDDHWVCQECMKWHAFVDKWEVLDNSGGDTKEQLWLYCIACDVETFYDLPDE